MGVTPRPDALECLLASLFVVVAGELDGSALEVRLDGELRALRIRLNHAGRGVTPERLELLLNAAEDGGPISDDVLSSVMAFFFFYVVSLGVLAVLLSLTGLDVITSVSGSVAAISNIGPGLGAEIGPSGNYGDLNTTAKGLLAIGMFVGRLELLAVLALFTRSFWRS